MTEVHGQEEIIGRKYLPNSWYSTRFYPEEILQNSWYEILPGGDTY
jgi:hypothetical protein